MGEFFQEEQIQKIIIGITKRITNEIDRLYFIDLLSKKVVNLPENCSYIDKVRILAEWLFAYEKELKEKKEKCARFGHNYGEWEKFKTRRIENGYNKGITIWTHTCKNCGYIETSPYEPIELIERRKYNILTHVPKKR